MTVRSIPLPGWRIPPLALDLALAAAVTGMGLISAPPVPPAPAGATPVELLLHVAPWVLLVVSTVSLALRRYLPLTVMFITTAALGASWVVEFTGAGWIAAFVASFSAGLQATDRRNVLIAFTVLGLTFLAIWGAGFASDVTDPFFPIIFLLFIGVWVAGDVLRTRTDQALALKEQAVRLAIEREQEAERAKSEERSRIARELHDVIAHSLSVIVIQAQAADRVLDHDPGSARGSLDAIAQTGRTAMVEMRRLLGVVRREEGEHGAPTAPQPSMARLEVLVGEMRNAGLDVTLRVEGEGAVTLPPGVDVSAYRIVQEALTNALRHADAARTEVVVRYLPDAVEVRVEDDGRGITSSARPDGTLGHGLVGMRERVGLLRGELDAGPKPGGGFLVRARLPLDGSAVP